MPVDSKKILDSAKADTNKVRFTIVLSPEVLDSFKAACDNENASYSSVIESLVKDFLGSYSNKKVK